MIEIKYLTKIYNSITSRWLNPRRRIPYNDGVGRSEPDSKKGRDNLHRTL